MKGSTRQGPAACNISLGSSRSHCHHHNSLHAQQALPLAPCSPSLPAGPAVAAALVSALGPGACPRLRRLPPSSLRRCSACIRAPPATCAPGAAAGAGRGGVRGGPAGASAVCAMLPELMWGGLGCLWPREVRGWWVPISTQPLLPLPTALVD